MASKKQSSRICERMMVWGGGVRYYPSPLGPLDEIPAAVSTGREEELQIYVLSGGYDGPIYEETVKMNSCPLGRSGVGLSENRHHQPTRRLRPFRAEDAGRALNHRQVGPRPRVPQSASHATLTTTTATTAPVGPKDLPSYTRSMSMTPPSLDQIVKGSPPPNASLNHVAASAFANPPPHDANDHLTSLKSPHPPSDPTALLPSSPPQIYLNLLILEASLRSQYLTLRARRRQNTFVLTLLAMWILFFFYVLWLRPREDGKGIGGSKYWLVDMTQKVCFITGVVTALLFWATGQWERGVRWPRRWIGVANRGLRGMNAKIVVIRGPWWRELTGWLAFILPFRGGLWGGETGGSSYHFINLSQEKKNDLGDGRPRHRITEDGKEYAEEDIASGGDLIKLLLLPKPFTPDFREGWEIYRTEYWERENERRSELRKRVRARRREIAREEGGWLWWTGWRGWKRARGIGGKSADVEKSGHHHHRHPSHTGSLKDRKRRPSNLRGREGSTHSRSSSRSLTPTRDIDDRLRPIEGRERRWSSSTTSSTATRSDTRRKKTSPTLQSGTAQMARQPSSRIPSGSRPTTPNETNPWQSKRASTLSNAESYSEYDGETSGYDGASSRNASGSMGPPPRPSAKRRQSNERDGFPNAPSA
ncbi:Spo7-domain-containing protein [Byssothecium circinans]|uniref:Spo7-domain-containing protein n=1 Tax=Byssothecium circinans TaxID=147558 RepID=A0A6A5TUE9_9PLEO|nr:Spo7-domain-containing protein [Byssothecium circinans]